MTVLDELAEAGYPVASIDELLSSKMTYKGAIPILLTELEREPDYAKKEWIARALSVPWAKPQAIYPLIRQYRGATQQDIDNHIHSLWAIGNAIEALWDDSYFDDYVELVKDVRFGMSRQMIVLGFGKSKRKDEASRFLLTLVNDPDVEGHAISALSRLAQPIARPALEAATAHSKAFIRTAAKRGLKRLG